MPSGAKGLPNAFSQEVAAILREKIGRRKAAQKLIAADVGISEAQLSAILNGKKHADIEQLDNVCRSIGIKLSDVVKRAEDETSLRDL